MSEILSFVCSVFKFKMGFLLKHEACPMRGVNVAGSTQALPGAGFRLRRLRLWIPVEAGAVSCQLVDAKTRYTISMESMVESLSPSSATMGVADTPSHSSSSGREKLDVPEHGSSLSARLTVLNLDSAQERQQRLARDSCLQPQPKISGYSTTGDVPSCQRSGWGLGQVGLQQKQEGPSLMEQMMEEAAAAKEKQVKETRKKQQRETKTTFANGLKKGFLARAGGGAAGSSTAPRKSRAGGKSKEKAQKGTRSSSNGGVSQSSSVAPAAGGKEGMPVITGRAASSGGLEFDVSAKVDGPNSGLVLPEVQAAMESSTKPLGGGNAAGGASGNWLTPELLDKIAEKPRLAAMLSDPRFSKAMHLMSTSPKDALGMFASSPEARDSFTELMALLADHFTDMGKAADKQAEEEEADRKRVADGPLAQEALRRAAEGVGVAASPATGEEKASVDRVLQQPELRELLMDPGMQRVLQECGEPSALARYMRHPEFGPKLQLMARAGLVSFSS